MNALAVNCAETGAEWSVPPGTQGGGASVPKFLVPISLSQQAHETLALAVTLAAASDGRLVLVHSVQLNIAGEDRGIGRGELLYELMKAAESRLAELAHSHCGDVPFSVIVTEGPPAEAILRTARIWNVDAIVMGAHDRRGLGWLRRNNLRGVLRQTSRPVYVVAPTLQFAIQKFPAKITQPD